MRKQNSFYTAPTLFLICVIMIVVIGFLNDQVSCQRSNPVRVGLNLAAREEAQAAYRQLLRSRIDTGEKHILDLQAYHSELAASRNLRVRVLDCSFPFPSTH